jgi:glycosyltransferase involved in cell wall biosynthesis
MESISVVVTVLNEESTINRLIQGLLNQIKRPNEIIIVDGGSTDKTLSKLYEFKSQIKVYKSLGNRSFCRNFGVNKSKGTIIAFTDAGCTPHPNWLKELTKPFLNPQIECVSGYYEGNTSTVFESCLVPYVLVMPDKVDVTNFFPSTRSMAIRKKTFEKYMGFDERLSHNEDYAFAFKLHLQGVKFAFAQNAIVDWIPRKNLRDSAIMFFRFSYGDIEAGIIRPKVKMLATRYLLGIFLILFIREFNWIYSIYFALIVFIVYSAWSVQKNYRYVRNIKALFWLPVLQFTSDMAVLTGSLVSLLNKAYT